jgi:hypothetical protein
MGKHDRDNETDGQWPEDKPLPKGKIEAEDEDDGKHSTGDDEEEQ